MTVVALNFNNPKICDLVPGAWFKYENEVYMKVEQENSEGRFHQAVCVSKGEAERGVCMFESNTVVTYITKVDISISE